MACPKCQEKRMIIRGGLLVSNAGISSSPPMSFGNCTIAGPPLQPFLVGGNRQVVLEPLFNLLKPMS